VRFCYGLLVLVAAVVLGGCSSGPNPVVVMETSMGTVKIELFERDAPLTVKNFLDYVDEKHYDGTIFHRVIADFMIQGGNLTPESKSKLCKNPIKNESYNGLSNKRGTLAMARTDAANSATDQFFINVVDTPRLDRANSPDRIGYCVFGKVIEGMDVVDKIRAVPTDSNAAPREIVLIKSIRRQQ
jgi:cyclophilin family peptidyl-prolyl cis-trans isomerase